MTCSHSYIGRFAPSPSGPLHFGSLIAALASFLDAKTHHGKWLVRMEDIDAPRCVPGADTDILRTLEAHQLLWDDTVLYQSRQHERYQAVLDDFVQRNLAYYCHCTRKTIRASGGVYQGHCRDKNLGPDVTAIRLKLEKPVTTFTDRILGSIEILDPHALEDTMLKRRDGLYAYNLVVVLDDIFQGITHIVRGSDLLTTTATHLSLYSALRAQPPEYAHVPVASLEAGRKLSKQNHAAALDNRTPSANISRALAFLGLPPPASLAREQPGLVLQWAIEHWDCGKLPQQREIIVAASESTYHTPLTH